VLLVGLAIPAGLLLLSLAPDRFVAGAAGLADRWGVSRVVIGALVIGVGTSTPELLVSGLAAAGGDQEVGVGNIVGSNMANLALVVPIAALICPLAVPDGLLRSELPLVIGATLLFGVLVQGGLSRIDGFVLAVGLIVVLVIVLGRAGRPAAPGDVALGSEVGDLLAEDRAAPVGRLVREAVGGLAGTLVGAHLLVTGSLEVADRAGLSGGFVGLTILAIGTSLPELVTAVAASRAGEHHLVLGNVVGSNLFNCLAVGTVVGLVGPSSVSDDRLTVAAVLLMVAITVAATVAMARHRTVRRHEALALLVSYLATLPLLAG
jgi:cation:H+ antiporter